MRYNQELSRIQCQLRELKGKSGGHIEKFTYVYIYIYLGVETGRIPLKIRSLGPPLLWLKTG